MDLELHRLERKYERLRIDDVDRQARMLSSLSKDGQQAPVIVVNGAGGGFVLIDGYRRVRALEQLGRDTVQALPLGMTEMEALLFCRRQQRGSGLSALEEGWLVRELADVFGLSLSELSVRMNRSKSWISRRLGLVRELPEVVHELVRTGKLCAHAAMKYLLPLARANAEGCVKLAQGIAGQKLTSRQVRELYVAWRVASAQERRRIEEQPLLFLRALEELQRSTPKSAPENKFEAMLRDLELLCGVCQRLHRKVRDEEQALAHVAFRRKLSQQWRQCVVAYRGLHEQMEESVDVGCGYADGGIAVEGAGTLDPQHCPVAADLSKCGAPHSVERPG